MKTFSHHRLWCCVCLLPSHRTEYLLVHFCGGTPLRYYSGFRTWCNGLRLHLSRYKWACLRPWHLIGARSCWIYSPCFDCRGGSSIGSGVRCRCSCGERIDEITRLAWDQSRSYLCCQTRSCILSLRCSCPLCGRRAYLIWPLWYGWLPAWCCPGCYPFTSFFIACLP